MLTNDLPHVLRGMNYTTYETQREASAAKAARADGADFYVYQCSDGYWALGRYAGHDTASGWAGI
jgi:hypothetical protein